MYGKPLIFFHGGKPNWDDKSDPTLKEFSTLNDAPKELLPSLTICVSNPNSLLTWLETNSCDLITHLHIPVPAYSPAATPQQWYRLFEKLQQASNIKHLEVHWDAEGPWGEAQPCNIEDPLHFGLGKSVVFVRGLALLKVKESIKIAGFYAQPWPGYLEGIIGIKPVNEQDVPGSDWARMLRGYQEGSWKLNPWVDTVDKGVILGSFAQPFKLDGIHGAGGVEPSLFEKM